MKKGTILRNDYVSDESPLRYSIFTSVTGSYMNAIYSHDGKIKKQDTINMI